MLNVKSNTINLKYKSNFFNKYKIYKEYNNNTYQINCIKKVLMERADVPEELIDWLISATKKNAYLECKYMNNKK